MDWATNILDRGVSSRWLKEEFMKGLEGRSWEQNSLDRVWSDAVKPRAGGQHRGSYAQTLHPADVGRAKVYISLHWKANVLEVLHSILQRQRPPTTSRPLFMWLYLLAEHPHDPWLYPAGIRHVQGNTNTAIICLDGLKDQQCELPPCGVWEELVLAVKYAMERLSADSRIFAEISSHPTHGLIRIPSFQSKALELRSPRAFHRTFVLWQNTIVRVSLLTHCGVLDDIAVPSTIVGINGPHAQLKACLVSEIEKRMLSLWNQDQDKEKEGSPFGYAARPFGLGFQQRDVAASLERRTMQQPAFTPSYRKRRKGEDLLHLGVSVEWLREEFIRDQRLRGKWNCHKVLEQIVLPSTSCGDLKGSYAELLRMENPAAVGTADVFVSYWWGARFKEVVELVLDFLRPDPSIRFIWLDIFAVNQHNAFDDLRAIDYVIAKTKGTVLCLAGVVNGVPGALHRMWCLYEVWKTLVTGTPVRFHRGGARTQDMEAVPKDGNECQRLDPLKFGSIELRMNATFVACRVYPVLGDMADWEMVRKSLERISVKEANTTVKEDKTLILREIRAVLHTYVFEEHVREVLAKCLDERSRRCSLHSSSNATSSYTESIQCLTRKKTSRVPQCGRVRERID